MCVYPVLLVSVSVCVVNNCLFFLLTLVCCSTLPLFYVSRNNITLSVSSISICLLLLCLSVLTI